MSERLAIWAFTTFHVVAFVVVILLVQFFGGGLAGILSNLNTLAGFAAFLTLWSTTRYTTARALAGSIATGSTDLLPVAIRWGAVNGWIFLVVLLLGAAVAAAFVAPSGSAPNLLFLIPLGVIATPFALVIGALVGLVFGIIDAALLEIARAVVRRGAR